MKLNKTLVITLLCSLGAQGQDFDDSWGAVVPGQSNSTSSQDSVKVAETPQSAVDGCQEGPSTQKSLPMKVLKSLGFDNLNLDADYSSNSVKISDSSVVSNCNSMLTAGISGPQSGSNYYALEVGIKGACAASEQKTVKDADGKDVVACPFQVKKKKDSDPENGFYEPNYKGFIACLVDTGAAKREGDKIVPIPEGYQVSSFKATSSITGALKTAPVYLKSRGYLAGSTNTPFGLVNSSKCTFIEKLASKELSITSKSDIDAQNEYQSAMSVCRQNDYLAVNDEINKFSLYKWQVEQWRDKLLLDRAKEVAALIKKSPEGITEDDASVLVDFKQYILEPLLDKIYQANENIKKFTGQKKKDAQTDLKNLLAQLQSYTKEPFFSKDFVEKLEAKGKFATAANIQSILFTANEYKSIGLKVNGSVVSAASADATIEKLNNEFATAQKKRSFEFEIKTGQATGVVAGYVEDANYYKKQVDERNATFLKAEQVIMRQMQEECYNPNAYYIDRNACVQNKQQQIIALEQVKVNRNLKDMKSYDDSLAKANYYIPLEREGLQYVAQKNGDATFVDTSAESLKSLKPMLTIQQQQTAQAQQLQGGLTGQNNVQNYQGNGGGQFNMNYQAQPQYVPQVQGQGQFGYFGGFPNQGQQQQQQGFFQQQTGANGIAGGLSSAGYPGYGYSNYGYQQPVQGFGAGVSFNAGVGAGYGNQGAYDPNNYYLLQQQQYSMYR